MRHAVRSLAILAMGLAPGLAPGLAAAGAEPARPRPAIPRIEGEYVHIYRPAPDVYPGPDVAGLVAGRRYEDWVPNDHCFVLGEDGRWHAFGITHPLTDLDQVHAGECQSFHAVAPEGPFARTLRRHAWTDRPKVLPARERPGEIVANHAPFVTRHRGEYRMIYGPSPLRLATSPDLFHWTPRGPLSRDPGGRDPSLLTHRGVHHLVVCGRHEVRMMTSRDLETWDEPRTILEMPAGVDPESPTLIYRRGTFYLFVCGWNGVWDRKDVSGAYQHATYVFRSDDPFSFDGRREWCRVKAHAPEVFRDERGDWYISSAEWPHRGVSVARLEWAEVRASGASGASGAEEPQAPAEMHPAGSPARPPATRARPGAGGGR